MNCLRSLFVVSVSVFLCTVGVESTGPCAQELENTADVPVMPGSYKPQCTEKGHYQLVQFHGSTGYKWCVDPSTGVKIEGTEVAPGQGEPTCPACAALLSKALDKILIGGYRPQCDSSGNFKRLQFSASTGLAWCADPASGQKLSQPQRHDGTLRCDAPKSRTAAQGACAQELAATADVPPMPGSYKPQCTPKGHYQLIQRHGSTGYSWCVNPTSGVKIEGTEVAPGEGQPACPACVVLLAKASNQMLIGAYRPQCDAAGLFKRVQISASTGMAWCADPATGQKTSTAQRYDGTLRCEADADSDARPQGPCEAAKALSKPLIGAFVPKCDTNGYYTSIQTHEGYRFCVDTNTGVQLPNSPKFGPGDNGKLPCEN
jgi:hypothetical protein